MLAAVVQRPPAPAIAGTAPSEVSPGLVDPLLILAAQALDDLETTRIANENRLRSLRDVYGLAGSKQEAEAAGLVDGLKALEHQAELSLKRALRRHPLGPWVARTVGVGEKQGARLLAAIGDPYINTLHDRPRTVSELWAYAGYHVLPASQVPSATQHGSAGGASTPGGGDLGHGVVDTQDRRAGVAPARARGQRANWSAEAKMRAFLIAESCIKQAASPYRATYDEGRAKYADAIHYVECRRCGPSGKPAQPGTPISAGHQHARALRLVSKAILRDLWLEARAIHEGTEQ
ncbi:MAG: TIGR-Tas system RNA-guided endonuclease [Blastococcus sp.]